jgi:hypothetical protein
MPVPNTKGAFPVTASNFEQPYTTPTFRPGVGGLNLRKTIDLLDPGELSRMSNLTWDREGQLTSRPGQISIATSGGGRVHSAKRLVNPIGATATRIWGIDTSVYLGLTGALSSVDSGYSGDPLSIVPYRPELSGQTWAYIADRNRMRKVRMDGLDLQIGLPAPTTVCGSALGAENRSNIALFAAADGTQAASWTGHAGTGGATPTPSDTVGGTEFDPGTHVNFTVTHSGSVNYYQFFSRAIGLNLNQVGSDAGTPTTSTADDHIHFWGKISNPQEIQEFRIYFVCSNNFDAASEDLPGTVANINSEAYVKSFRPGDLAAFFGGNQTGENVQEDTAKKTAEKDFLDDSDLKRSALEALSNVRIRNEETGLDFKTQTPKFLDEDGNVVSYRPHPTKAGQQLGGGTRVQPAQGGSGSHEWVEFGVAGNPLRKSDFRRIGGDLSRDWGTITGIIIYIGGVPDAGVDVALSQMYLTGGCGPDNTDVGAAGYDYRNTDFDPRTGAESNPSPILPDAEPYGIFSVRRCVTLTPAASGDSALRQRFYRRGGALGDNWYFLGVNTSDGGTFSDDLSDSAITNADSVEIDHDQPITTVDTNGDILRAQPLAAMWGPVQDLLFGCGDRWRAGHLYWCILGEPDHWSSVNNFEVCSTSEELMNGGYYGGQAFVFSRERMYWIYPNLSGDGTVTVTPSGCSKGLFSRWGLTVANQGIFFVNRDGIWRTTGGNPDLVSGNLGDEDDGGIFSGTTVNGYAPIDWGADGDIQLEVWGTELWFQYRDTGGTTQHLVFDLQGNRWKHYSWGVEPGTMFVDKLTSSDGDRMILGSRAGGDAYAHDGTSDNGAAIVASGRTGALDGGRGREDKLFGDLLIDMDRDALNISIQVLLNDETVSNSVQTITAGTGRQRYVLDSFGTVPQRGRSASVDFSWSGTRLPRLEQMGISVIPEPESTNLRATQWDDCGSSNEKWLYGVMIEADTYGVDRPVIVEFFQGTSIVTADTFTINHDGRKRHFETWPFVRADRVRVRPVTDCAPWILYELDWLHHEQPPRLKNPDSGEEGPWDTYYTGLDLDINTFGQTKKFNVYVDGVLLTNPVTGTTVFEVNTANRDVHHWHFGPGRGHIYRWTAIDENPCLVYNHRWHLDEEPSEQANWNQNFSILGTHTDKWIKGVKLECDTFGVNKTVTIEVDGAVAATLTINTPDRRVVHEAFPQVRGRVVRILPTDNNPGRLYTASLIFDEEPLGLDRWETQELTLGAAGWKALLEGWITLRSSDTVNLAVTHVREDGSSTVRNYTLPDTAGVKTPHYLTFEADKAVLFKFLFTSASDFWLYREESSLKVMLWNGGLQEVKPFGNDDLDLQRGMWNAEAAASKGGGES